MVTVFLHCWQRTEQHQENLQEQRCTTSARPALYPCPQHTNSQPSGASREVPGLLRAQKNSGYFKKTKHSLPCVSLSVLQASLTIASSTSCSWDSVLWIKMTEIWGGCKVEQVSGSRGFNLRVPGQQSRSGSDTGEADLRRHDVKRARLETQMYN